MDHNWTVSKRPQTITFNAQTPATRDFVAASTFAISPAATASSTLAVTYTSTTTGVCTVSGTTVTMVAAGTCTIAANQSGDATYAPAAQVTQDVVFKQGQTITFNPPTPKTYGDAAFTISASSTSGLTAFTFSVLSGPCTISTATVTITGAGTCQLRAYQAGNGTYNEAESIKNVTINKATPTVTLSAQTVTSRPFSSPATFAINPTTVTVTPVTGQTVTYGSANTSICTVSGTTVTMITVGTCPLNATVTANANYNQVTSASQNVTITAGTPTISVTTAAPAGPIAYNSSFSVAATAPSGAVTIAASGGCSGGSTTGSATITMTSPTTACTVTYSRAAVSPNWNAATNVTSSTTAKKADQTITFGGQANRTFVTAGTTFPLNPAATASSGLAVSYSSLTTGVCTIATPTVATVTMVSAGTCTIAANQAGNTNWNAVTPQVTQSFNIWGDSDVDGIQDNLDNCPTVSNVAQTDSDGDTLGNACDYDTDGDGIDDMTGTNPHDNCKTVANTDQTNTDADAYGDVCEPDFDADGFVNAGLSTDDNCPYVYNPTQTDSDGDHLGNECEALFVKPAATGLGDCSSWANACAGSGAGLQAAITKAANDGASQLYLAKGIYKPTATVNLAAGISIRGGFAGVDELYYYEALPKTNLTIITGANNDDIVDANGIVQTVANQGAVANIGPLLKADTLGTAAASTISLSGLILNAAGSTTDGGALYVSGSRVSIDNVKFIANKATNGAAVFMTASSKGVVEFSEIYNNSASASGAAISANGSTEVSFNGVNIHDNTAVTSGGALYLNTGRAAFSKSTLKANKANTGSGGAIYGTAFAYLSLSETTVEANQAVSSAGGGGMYAGGNFTDLDINKTTFKANTSAGAAGALLMPATTGTVVIQDSSFDSNTAVTTGGAIDSAATGALTMDGVLFNANKSTSHAGAMSLTNGIVDINNATFFANEAGTAGSSALRGGAINFGAFASATQAKITHSTFVNNKVLGTTSAGGAININSAATGSFKLTNSLVLNNTAVTAANLSIGVAARMTDGGYNEVGLASTRGVDVAYTLAPGSFTSTKLNVTDITETVLKKYSGTYMSLALKPTSDARDIIPNGVNGCVTDAGLDGRGFDRPDMIDQNDPDQLNDVRLCDIGAFEFNNAYRTDCFDEDGLRPDAGSGLGIYYCADGTAPTAPQLLESVVGSTNYWLLLLLSAGLLRSPRLRTKTRLAS